MASKQKSACNNASQAQLHLLDEFMSKHSALAKGSFLKAANGRDCAAKLWVELKAKLNAAGPPIKTVAEWKRVWTTRKYKAKKKLSENKRSIRQTGGGPYDIQQLTTAEETVIDACGFEATVSGISDVGSYGVDQYGSESEMDIENDPPAGLEHFGCEDVIGNAFPVTHESENPTPLVTPVTSLRRVSQPQMLRRQVQLTEQFVNASKEMMEQTKMFQTSIMSTSLEQQRQLKSIKYELRDFNGNKKKENVLLAERNKLLERKLNMLENEKQQNFELTKRKLELQKINIEVLQAANELKRLKIGTETA
ncbi:uncharacterized protein LOC131696348 [Topomyia yanbarensis]|uniref:uncharacterized protein LOC131687974 n=1 Tax=Topomyia yanbarensis TaxID=2498891 RepID=UPI00273BE611|nr:uncharacterized protein LOC131687974 [Topomyia yanbarensis]XP_058840876.1 uncharacterized protein LOC131696348 [Topomyia yanbarensis]